MYKYIFILILFLLFHTSTIYGKMLDSENLNKKETILDSGNPIINFYTVDEVSQYLGNRVFVRFIEEGMESQIIVKVQGILVSRHSKDEFLLLGKTDSKNRIVIPINTIIYIQLVR